YSAWRFGDEIASRFHPSVHQTAEYQPRPATAAPVATPGKAQPLNQVRPVYPFSVITGGVHSVAELKLAMQFDPVVATHFADFDLESTRVERVAVSRAVYVSYRAGDRVRWTSKRLSLRAGETILTDGQNAARTRCGNRIVEVAPAEVSVEDEPAPETLDAPLPSRTLPIDPLAAYDLFVVDGDLPAPLDATDPLLPSSPLPDSGLTTVMTDLPGMDISQVPLLPVFVVGSDPGSFGLDPVPEPATLLLVSPGLAGYALWRRVRRRKARPGSPVR
ncbi:MAG: PEP-CTERM sorting domain-containing protein, partial [Chloroflexi bacterium]|nr:PEP-CTERM sorting domain-containing protein [Chloroflexota bacterium]